MKFIIKHEIKGRIRVHMCYEQISFKEADMIQYALLEQSFITGVKIYERTKDAVICYTGERTQLIAFLKQFSLKQLTVPEYVWQNSGREVNREYWDKLVWHITLRVGKKCFLPVAIREILVFIKAVKYIWKGIQTLAQRKIEVAVLDATAIGVSICRGDFETAGSVMFLLGIGEILEEWTHKKSVDDLARSMALNVSNVWVAAEDGREILTKVQDVKQGDIVRIHVGHVVPFDGIVIEGSGALNQSSITGESVAVLKEMGSYVYAGTVLEEGELLIQVKEQAGANRYEKIIAMIEETEKLKSSMEGQAAHLADRLVPYTLLGTAAVYLFTRNVTRALSVLMVDFSCALKLAMPVAVLSAIREANTHHITVKGGKFLEQIQAAETIVFDKTGTLTNASPTVVDVISFCDKSAEELLCIAACLEEHFPHSMAKAVVEAAQRKGLTHEEKHSKVEYIVAHGISSIVEGEKVVIGSYHFIFEDEGCYIPKEKQALFDHMSEEYSRLFLAIEGRLAAVIMIEDPIRKEASQAIRGLKEAGFSKVVMLTGDNKKTARSVARKIGIDEYHAEVLPEEKAQFIEQEKALGRTVVMVGDGINDSPALSAADVGIAINDGAQIAREIADITMDGASLNELVVLKKLSNLLTKRVRKNYRNIVGINSGLILLGVCGIVQPTTSALIHNVSTLAITVNSMKDLLE